LFGGVIGRHLDGRPWIAICRNSFRIKIRPWRSCPCPEWASQEFPDGRSWRRRAIPSNERRGMGAAPVTDEFFFVRGRSRTRNSTNPTADRTPIRKVGSSGLSTRRRSTRYEARRCSGLQSRSSSSITAVARGENLSCDNDATTLRRTTPGKLRGLILVA